MLTRKATRRSVGFGASIARYVLVVRQSDAVAKRRKEKRKVLKHILCNVSMTVRSSLFERAALSLILSLVSGLIAWGSLRHGSIASIVVWGLICPLWLVAFLRSAVSLALFRRADIEVNVRVASRAELRERLGIDTRCQVIVVDGRVGEDREDVVYCVNMVEGNAGSGGDADVN